MGDESELSEELLAEIRRAAFDLRRTDPQAAVRVLRNVASKGGGTELLARGALAEIYLEEFGDLDAAEAEFRAVLKGAPGLPAAELGLGRTLRESGRLTEADRCLVSALDGFSRDVAELRQRAGEPEGEATAAAQDSELAEGAEEAVLVLLEVAVELAELRHQIGENGSVAVPLDESLLLWARKTRLFDALDEPDDWIRFHLLWTRLRVHTGRAAEAAAVLAAAEAGGELPAAEAARLRSEVLEEAGDLPGALLEARRLLEIERTAGRLYRPDDVSHLAGLLQATGDEAAAKAVLHEALAQAERALAGVEGGLTLGEEERQALRETVKGWRESLGPTVPVTLGRR
jgi:hypothetical protein